MINFSHRGNYKISEDNLPKIMSLIKDGVSSKEIAERFFVSYRTIHRIKNKQTYKGK